CLISSGTLLVTVKPGDESKALRAISSLGVNSSIIGRVTSGERILLRGSGEEIKVSASIKEQLWDALRTKL
ncbi:MAG: AIR synthase-related protein, partial [Candidatus Jordarchaeaceae archaeon]